jgi:hypothetical protein
MGTDKQGAHSYADAYEWHFRHLRHRAITLVEIGVGGYRDSISGGESLRMWKEFFPKAQIIGIDIHPKEGLSEDRITILQGDQSDENFLEGFASRYGPFDVVIDDGSHICAHVIASFRALFPHLAEDGIYAIEDLQTSYWARGYGGSSGQDRAGTSMTFLQQLVDGLNYAEFDIPNYLPTYTDTRVRSLTFYHNMAFVQKGPNTEKSNVLQPHPRPRTVLALPSASVPTRSPASPPRRWFRRLVPKRLRGAMRSTIRAIVRAASGALGRSHDRDP